jgi:hypothetical protein
MNHKEEFERILVLEVIFERTWKTHSRPMAPVGDRGCTVTPSPISKEETCHRRRVSQVWGAWIAGHLESRASFSSDKLEAQICTNDGHVGMAGIWFKQEEKVS